MSVCVSCCFSLYCHCCACRCIALLGRVCVFIEKLMTTTQVQQFAVFFFPHNMLLSRWEFFFPVFFFIFFFPLWLCNVEHTDTLTGNNARLVYAERTNSAVLAQWQRRVQATFQVWGSREKNIFGVERTEQASLLFSKSTGKKKYFLQH